MAFLWTLLTAFNTVMYFSIMKLLRERERCNNTGIVTSDVSQSRQVAVMLVANGTVFFACCAAITANMLLHVLHSNNLLKWSYFSIILYDQCVDLIFSVNCSINPVVYGLTNKRYRDTFFRVMKDIFYRKPNVMSAVSINKRKTSQI